MSGTLLVVPTSDRPGGVSYLNATLVALGPVPAGWSRIEYPNQDGTRAAFWKVLEWTLNYNYSKLLWVEDDVIAEPGFLELVENYEVPGDVSLVSFFDYRPIVPGRHRVIGFLSSCAILLPRQTVEWLWRCGDPTELQHYHPEKARNALDQVLATQLYRSPWPWYEFAGSHVEHVGNISSVMQRPTDPHRAHPAGIGKI